MFSLEQIFKSPDQISQRTFDVRFKNTVASGENANNDDILWICRHHFLTIELINENKNINWNMDAISLNYAIHPKCAITYPDLKWNFKLLSYHPKLEIYIINHYYNKDWDYNYISTLPYINIKTIILSDQLQSFANPNSVIKPDPNLLTYEEMKDTLYGFGNCGITHEIIYNTHNINPSEDDYLIN